MSLYLKYRPQGFVGVVGQEHVIRSIQNAIRRQAVHHAYLFCGPRGTGKTSLARIIAKAINCTQLKNGEPCDACETCRNIREGRLVDLIEIDGASNRGIDEIRELREKIQFSPTQAKKKIYIIDEVHMLTKEAFNALLKTLEEPPSHAHFILATTEAHKIPETILSRCQQFTFQRIGTEPIYRRLKEIADHEKIKAETEALKLIAYQSSGGLRDAIGLLEQMNIGGEITMESTLKNLGLTGQKRIDDFMGVLFRKETRNAVKIINEINAEGQNLHQFAAEVIASLREQMLLGVGRGERVEEIIRLIDLLTEARQAMNRSAISQLPLEIAVIKACDAGAADRAATIHELSLPTLVPATPPPSPPPVIESIPAAIMHPEEISLQTIQKEWQRILNHIETPFVRMSFLDSEPVQWEKNTLTLHFKSESFREKIAKPANQAVIIKTFESLFNVKIKLKLAMKKIDLKPIQSDKEKRDQADPPPTVIQMAEEVFGVKS